MTKPSTRVFAYSDYRQFLKEFHEEAKRLDRNFSHRFIASKVGASSAGWFSDILKGRINLTGSLLAKLVHVLGLKESESDYFEALVQYNQAGSIEEKNRHFRRMMAFKEMRADVVGADRFEFYSKWYYTAIRELLFFHEVREGEYDVLAKKLEPPIKPAQAKEAVALLQRLDFITKDAQGRLRPTSTTLKKDSSFKSLFAANFLRTNMELAMEALEKFQKEQRHISAMTLSYSPAAFDQATAEIETLRRKLLALMEGDPSPEKVFQLNIQFFPVTQ